MKCSECKYWDPFDDYLGLCRINSPAVLPNAAELSGAAAWPCTRNTDWCGEFWEKEAD